MRVPVRARTAPIAPIGRSFVYVTLMYTVEMDSAVCWRVELEAELRVQLGTLQYVQRYCFCVCVYVSRTLDSTLPVTVSLSLIVDACVDSTLVITPKSTKVHCACGRLRLCAREFSHFRVVCDCVHDCCFQVFSSV